MLLMLPGFTYERNKSFIVLHVSEIKGYYVECVLVFEILSVRSH